MPAPLLGLRLRVPLALSHPANNKFLGTQLANPLPSPDPIRKHELVVGRRHRRCQEEARRRLHRLRSPRQAPERWPPHRRRHHCWRQPRRDPPPRRHPGGPWKLYAVSADNNINSISNLPVERIPCDVSDPADALAKLSPLADVTHLFHLSPDPAALSNVLSAILPSAANLQHVCLITGGDHYLGSEPPFHEELPRRLDSPNPNYHLEDILLDELSKPENSVTWSVHRPSTLFGFSPSGKFNLVSTLCVYASICRKEGAFLRWPGTRVAWEGYSNASDADLVAEHQIWAAVDQYAKNEAFNCSNGDVFKWKQLWPMLAEQFGIGWVGYEGEEARFKLAEAMEGKRGLWEEMVAEHELVPSRLEEVGDWEFTDTVLNVEESCLHSMNKSKEHGFFGFRNTMPSFESWIDKVRSYKIVP